MRAPDRGGIPRGQERGAALLTVLMLVAIIAVMAGAALEKLRLSTRLAGNAATGEQARAYAFAAETMALTRVSTLLGQSPKRVTLAGNWSNTPFGLPVPGGFATARVRDGGNCFNLNGLVKQVQGAPGTYITNPEVWDVKDGHIDLLTKPGLGIDINEEAIRALSIGCKAWPVPEFRGPCGELREW